MSQRIRSSIPRKAREVTQYDDRGEKITAEYYVDGDLVGRRYWNVDGVLEWEQCFLNGRPAGTWREFHPNGQLQWEEHYREGLVHGLCRQWNENGKLIGPCPMNMGTGVDLWWGCSDEFPNEERNLLNGLPHGFERWWSSRARVYSEDHWKHGERHGISRRWAGAKIERGYPEFYILGKKVTKREYLKAAKSDTTLPPYDPKDDSPRRKPLSLPLDRSRRLVGQIVKDSARARHTK